MSPLLVIAGHTLHEALRRRVLAAAGLGGLAFLALFATGFHFVVLDLGTSPAARIQRPFILNIFTLLGLYAANFLGVLAAVLLPLDTVAGEISSGAIHTLATKPIRRAELLLGKWLGYLIVLVGYVLVVALGVVAIVRLRSGFAAPGLHLGIPLMLLETALLASVAVALATRFSAIASGIAVFGLHGLAFIGGWVEQFGAMLGNQGARSVGTVASLVMPSEVLWQMAAATMQPAVMLDMRMSPFSPASVPTPAMVGWAAGYLVLVLGLGLRHFQRRAL